MSESKPLVIMGANASGKTRFALEIAGKRGGEIISADSRQVYRHLSAGTSKPRGKWIKTPEGKFYLVDGVPYHLVDILDPKESYDAAGFSRDASKLIKNILKRKKWPIIAGGTGMYIQALWNGLDKMPKADPAVRKRLAGYAEKFGRRALHERLKKTDPEAAAKIPPANLQRIIRALEVQELAGKPISKIWSGRFFNSLPTHLADFVFLKWPKRVLAGRIRKRTHDCFDEWVRETKTLLSMGYSKDCPGLKSLGYPAVMDYIESKISARAAADKIVTLSLAYAKRQNTWFSKYKNIKVLTPEDPENFDPGKISAGLLR